MPALTKAERLAELSMPTELARETASQIAGAVAAKSQVAALTALTAATGTPSATIVDVGSSFTQATLNNNFKSLADKVNSIIAALKA